jgi:hypothetical protein
MMKNTMAEFDPINLDITLSGSPTFNRTFAARSKWPFPPVNAARGLDVTLLRLPLKK